MPISQHNLKNRILMGMKKRTKVSAEFSMSSLTDIIFLLLIFFMLTSSMVVPNALNLRLPGTSKKKNDVQPKYPPFEVKIKSNGSYLLDNASASFATIEKKARDRKKQSNKVSMIVSPDGKAPNEKVVAILDMAYRYQIDAIMGKYR